MVGAVLAYRSTRRQRILPRVCSSLVTGVTAKTDTSATSVNDGTTSARLTEPLIELVTASDGVRARRSPASTPLGLLASSQRTNAASFVGASTVCASVTVLYAFATYGVYLERNELARLNVLSMPPQLFYKLGIVLCVYAPQYWIARLLWRGMDFFLPTPPPADFRGFALAWLRFALQEDLMLLWRRCVRCCSCRRNDDAGIVPLPLLLPLHTRRMLYLYGVGRAFSCSECSDDLNVLLQSCYTCRRCGIIHTLGNYSLGMVVGMRWHAWRFIGDS